MSALDETLAAIRANYSGEDYIDRVKRAVGDEFRALDGTAIVEDTRYFNHSAIPDFVLSWPTGKLRRDVYIRGSYASIVVGDDVAALPKNDPVFMALDARQQFSPEMTRVTAEDIRRESTKAQHTLMTDVSAVGSLREVSTAEPGRGPLTALVQSNFVRGARGLVDTNRADALVSTQRTDGKTTISDTLRETFSAETFERMERTAAIVDLALASSPDAESQVLQLEASAKLTGRLSAAEVSTVLPWVLSNDDINPPASFWARLGALITFEDLEEIADLIRGVDITRFVAANADTWQVRRAYITATDYADVDRETRVWRFNDALLSVDSDYHRIFVSASANKLRGRSGAPLPRWDDIQDKLLDFRVQTIGLQGIQRGITIDAARSENVRADAQSITESVVDDYRIQNLTLRFLAPTLKQGVSDVAVDLPRRIATATRGVSIEEMLRVALRVLAHRNPVALEQLPTFFTPPELETDEDETSESQDVVAPTSSDKTQPRGEAGAPSRLGVPPQSSTSPLGIEAGSEEGTDETSREGSEPDN